MHQLKTMTFLYALIALLSFAICDNLSPQEKLLEKFFGSSRRMADVIPKKNLINSTSPLKVNFTFTVSHIFDIKSDEEEADLGFFISMSWSNELVSWNINEYPIKYLEVPTNRVWIPKIYLMENAFSTFLRPDLDSSTAMIFPDGATAVDFGIKIKLTCPMPACLFPMDKHDCPLTFFSPTHLMNNLVLLPDNQKREDYKFFSKSSTGLWNMKVHDIYSGTQEFRLFNGENANISKLMTKISFEHKPQFFWLTIFAPITILCIITFCAVLLPRENGERTSLLITCMLAQIVYLDTVLKSVPKSSDYIPLLVMFLCIVLLFTASQIGLTAVTSYYAEKADKGKTLSPCHQKFARFFTKLCMIGKKRDNQVKSLKQDSFYQNEVELRKKPSLEISANHENSDDNHVPMTELPTFEEETDLPDEKEQNGNQPKVCKKMCKAIDRFSMLTSLFILISTPILFQLMYDGTIKYDCSFKG